MRILHEVDGLVTPYGPDIMFQEERMAKLYTAFSFICLNYVRKNICEGFINSSLMRILHEVDGLVTPYGPNIMFQEERMAKLYTAFSPKEYECLKNALGLISVNKTLDLEQP